MNSTNKEPAFSAGLQFVVFALVAAAFTTVYITQPVLPVIREEFKIDETTASLTISAVIFGIALSNLPLGSAADRFPIKPIIFIGGCVISMCGFVCALTSDMTVLIATRFVQGLFIPCLTTCVAAYLSKTLPVERLNVVMGSYVSATVAGGFYLGKKYFNLRVGLIAAAIFATVPFLVFFDRMALTDSMLAASFLWSLILALNLVQKVNLKNIIILGLVLGTGIWVKTPGIFSFFALTCDFTTEKAGTPRGMWPPRRAGRIAPSPS